MPRFNTLAEMPDWAKPTVKKLIDKGIVQGSGKKDTAGLPADINLSEDMLRMLVWNDRAGVYG